MRVIVLLFLFAACSAPRPQAKPEPKLLGPKGCFLLYDMKAKNWVKTVNEAQCRVRHSPCSTFKIPLAIMAFDAHALEDETSARAWDGQQHPMTAWNQDQTAASWMRQSVVWFSQILTKELGRSKIQNYLHAFKYGNGDFSGGLTNAWLSSTPFTTDPPKVSVGISGYEQINFLERFWKADLPVSMRSIELTKKILFLEKTPHGFELSGKTGSGFEGPINDLRLGWFVAHLQGHGQEFLAVVQFTDELPPPSDASYGGHEAKAILLKYLEMQGLY